LTKPPGSIPQAGGWNACPYSGSGREHMAVDYTSALGTPIPAGLDSVIQHIRFNGDPKCYANGCTSACLASGDFIVLKSACGDPKKPENDLFVRYYHISAVKKGLSVGDKVKKGEIIGFVGESGCATGPHVHLQTATFPKGTYKKGERPLFGSCQSTIDPSTRLCKNL
jgi:murein DD-endopeptidase MepM/ murein hydrolase activator NlpD